MATQYPTIPHRRGATFSYTGFATLPAGTWTAACALETSLGALVEALTVTLTPLGTPGPNGETHAMLLEAPAANSAAWPLATIVGDITFTDSNGVVLCSPPFAVVVQRGVTNVA